MVVSKEVVQHHAQPGVDRVESFAQGLLPESRYTGVKEVRPCPLERRAGTGPMVVGQGHHELRRSQRLPGCEGLLRRYHRIKDPILGGPGAGRPIDVRRPGGVIR